MDEQERTLWDAIKAEYIAGEMTVREIAEKHGVSANKIYKKATSDGWKKLKEKISQKTEEKYIARVARVRVRELETITTAAAKMSALLDKTVDELSEMPTDKRLRNLKGLSATASAIYSNTETLMKLHGIQTPAQEAAQKIARQRLALDQRKQRFEEGKTKDANAPKKVELVVELSPGMETEGDIDG